MLNIRMDRKSKEPAVICASGTVDDIVTEIMMLIGGVDSQLEAADPAVADAFESCLEANVGDLNSIAWKKPTIAVDYSIQITD